MSAKIIYIKYYVKDEAPAEGERFPDEQETTPSDDGRSFVPSPLVKRIPKVAREEGDADDTIHESDENLVPHGRSQAV